MQQLRPFLAILSLSAPKPPVSMTHQLHGNRKGLCVSQDGQDEDSDRSSITSTASELQGTNSCTNNEYLQMCSKCRKNATVSFIYSFRTFCVECYISANPEIWPPGLRPLAPKFEAARMSFNAVAERVSNQHRE